MSAPAPLATRILNQGSFETKAVLRNGEQLVLAIVLPILVFAALTVTPILDSLGVTDLVGTTRVNIVTPGILALCALSTAFTGQGIATGFDRRYGVLKFMATTPLGKFGLIAGKTIAVLAVLALQTALITVIALFSGWQPNLIGIPLAIIQLILGALAFTALGLLIAGTCRPEATLALTNLLWVLLTALGGIVVPIAHLPEFFRPFAQVLPSAALGDALRAALIEGTFNPVASLVLVAWAAAASLLAIRYFKWS